MPLGPGFAAFQDRELEEVFAAWQQRQFLRMDLLYGVLNALGALLLLLKVTQTLP